MGHQRIPPHVAMSTEDWFDFRVGERVMTREGIVGTVTELLEGPTAGSETYIVVLDNGLGGGEYGRNDLSSIGPAVTSLGVGTHDATFDAEGSFEALAEGHFASEDYPELAEIIVRRPPPRIVSTAATDHKFCAYCSHPIEGEAKKLKTGKGRVEWAHPGCPEDGTKQKQAAKASEWVKLNAPVRCRLNQASGFVGDRTTGPAIGQVNYGVEFDIPAGTEGQVLGWIMGDTVPVWAPGGNTKHKTPDHFAVRFPDAPGPVILSEGQIELLDPIPRRKTAMPTSPGGTEYWKTGPASAEGSEYEGGYRGTWIKVMRLTDLGEFDRFGNPIASGSTRWDGFVRKGNDWDHVAEQAGSMAEAIAMVERYIDRQIEAGKTAAHHTAAGWIVVNNDGEILFGPVENRFSADNALDDLQADPENDGAGLYVQRSESANDDFHEGEGIGTTVDPMEGNNPFFGSVPVQIRTRAGFFTDKIDQATDKIRGDNPPGYAWSYDWCRFRRQRHCWYPKVADHEGTKEAGYMVWVPEDRGICERDKWDAQKICPIAQPGPHSGAPNAMVEATIPWSEGGQRGGMPDPKVTGKTSTLHSAKARLKRIEQVQPGEVVDDHGHLHIVKRVLKSHFTMDPGSPNDFDGDGLVNWFYFQYANGDCSHHEPEGSQVLVDDEANLVTAGLDAEYLAAKEWHLTASWEDVRDKAVDIRASGGVRVVSSNAPYFAGEVEGSHGTYHPEIMRRVGTNEIGTWWCDCPWNRFAWARSTPFKHLEGRPCSHVFALQYELQSRGMFGAEIKEGARHTAMPALQVNPSTADIVEWYLQAAQDEDRRVTGDMVEVAKREGGELEGLDFRTKSRSSLERKIRGMNKGGDPRRWIGDALRYTMVFHPADYSVQVQKALYALEEKGYHVSSEENSWARGDTYSGLHYNLVDRSGLKIEVQFHTEDSYNLKQKTLHKMYEEFRRPDTPIRRKQQLWVAMTHYWDKVEIPKDVLLFPEQKRFPFPLGTEAPPGFLGMRQAQSWIDKTASAPVEVKYHGRIVTLVAVVPGGFLTSGGEVAPARDVIYPTYDPTLGLRYNGAKTAAADGIPAQAPETSSIPPGHYRLFHRSPLANAGSIRREGLGADHSRQHDFSGEMVWGSCGFRTAVDPQIAPESDWCWVEYHVEWDSHANPPKPGNSYTSGSIPPNQIIAIWEPWHFAVWHLVEEMSGGKSVDQVAEDNFGFQGMPVYQRASEWLRTHQAPAWMRSMRTTGAKTAGWADDLLAHGGQVTIYRACPDSVNEFRSGDWVALDDGYCNMHADGFAEVQGEPWHTISASVPASSVRWAGEDKDEWYQDTGEKREFFYVGGPVKTGALQVLADSDIQGHGVMIALVPPESLSQTLIDTVAALNPDAEPQSLTQSHITLAYLGKTDAVEPERLERVISAFSYGAEPLAGRVSGLGVFQNYDGDVAVALWDIPGLDAWRTRLVEWLEDAGIEVSKNHSFTPHTTLSYGDTPPVLPTERLPDAALEEIKFESFAMVHGQSWSYFTMGEGEATTGEKKAASKVAETIDTTSPGGYFDTSGWVEVYPIGNPPPGFVDPLAAPSLDTAFEGLMATAHWHYPPISEALFEQGEMMMSEAQKYAEWVEDGCGLDLNPFGSQVGSYTASLDTDFSLLPSPNGFQHASTDGDRALCGTTVDGDPTSGIYMDILGRTTCPRCLTILRSKTASLDVAFEAMVGPCTESPHTSMNTWKDTGQTLSTEDLEQIARDMGMTEEQLLDAQATQQKYYNGWLWRKTRERRHEMWGHPDAPLILDTRPAEGPSKPIWKHSPESLAETLEWSSQVKEPAMATLNSEPVLEVEADLSQWDSREDEYTECNRCDGKGCDFCGQSGRMIADDLRAVAEVLPPSNTNTVEDFGYDEEVLDLATGRNAIVVGFNQDGTVLLDSGVSLRPDRLEKISGGTQAHEPPMDFNADLEARIAAAVAETDAQSAEATIHEEPEAALPITDGVAEPDLGSINLDHLRPAHLAPGGGGGGSDRRQAHAQGNAEIAAMATAFLKQGMKVFSPAEQQDLIEEGVGVTAGNLDLLDLEGTHYNLMGEPDDDSWL